MLCEIQNEFYITFFTAQYYQDLPFFPPKLFIIIKFCDYVNIIFALLVLIIDHVVTRYVT